MTCEHCGNFFHAVYRGMATKRFCNRICIDRAWRAKNPDKVKAASVKFAPKRPAYDARIRMVRPAQIKRVSFAAHLKHRYGLTPHEYAHILESQGHVCAICGECPGRGLGIDHNHETGAVRGALCVKCNAGIGNFKEDEERMEKAIAYLRRHANLKLVNQP